MKFTKKQSAKVKGAAICLLLFHHLFYIDRGYEVKALIMPEPMLRTMAVAARVCVWIFVFVTAYGIAVLYRRKKERQSVQQFVFWRWFSLMKNFWFAYLFLSVLMLMVGENLLQIYKNNLLLFLLDFFSLSDLFGSPLMFGSWWYLCLAQVIVILLPIWIRACDTFGGATAALCCLLGAECLRGRVASHYGGDYSMYLMAEIMGILCVQYHFFERLDILFCRLKRRGKAFYILGLEVAIIGVAALVYGRFAIVAETFSYNAMGIQNLFYAMAAMGSCALIFMIREKHIEKLLVYLGNHSGNIFFVHIFCLQYAEKLVFFTTSALAAWLTLLALSCLASVFMEDIKERIRYNEWMNAFACSVIRNWK